MKAWLEFYPGDAWSLGVLAIVAQVTAVLLAASALSIALKRRPAARHALWLSALALVLAAPATAEPVWRAQWASRLRRPLALVPSADQHRVPPEPAAAPVHSPLDAEPIGAQSDPPAAESLASPAPQAEPAKADQPLPAQRWRSPGDWLRVAFVAASATWAVGVLLFLARLGHGLFAAHQLRMHALPCHDSRILRLADLAAEQVGLKRRPALLLSAAATGPLYLGLVRPAVVLPPGLAAALDDASLGAVLRHELAHAGRRDTLVGLVEQALRAVWWPHPLVWLLCRELDRAREEVCDNAALLFGEPACYAETLLAVAALAGGPKAATPGYAFLGRKQSFETRIVNLLDRRRIMTTKAPWATRISVAMVVGMVGVLAAWETRAVRVAAATEPVADISAAPKQAEDGEAQKEARYGAPLDGEPAKPARSVANEALLVADVKLEDIRSQLVLAETNLNRGVAAEQQARAVEAAYHDGTVTLDLVLDSLRRRCDATVAYYLAVRNLRRAVVGHRHWAAIDHECLDAQWGSYQQLREDSRRVWEQIKALYDKGLKGGEAEKEAQTRELFFLASKLLAEHETALAASNEVLRVGKASNVPDLYVITHSVADLLDHPDGDAKRQLELLRDMIQRMVAPDSWHETHGGGSVTVYQDRCLIISQTEAVHQQITKFLEHLRSLRETPAADAKTAKP